MPSLFKRLNNVVLVQFGAIFIFAALVGCRKKDRLSAPTFNFSISPPASTLLKTESITLTAHGSSGAGSVDVNPTWTVSSASLGSLNTSIGPTVVFQPLALGDVVVSATHDGIVATSQLAIVTYKPNSNTFDVYNDNGLPTGSDVNSDIFTSGPFLQELSSGYTPEGVKYQRATNVNTNDFWGVTLDKLGTGKKKDLSAFASGTLKFSLRLARTLSSSESIRIDVEDTSHTVSFTLVSSSDGYNRLNTDWQEISLSLSSRFPGLDLTQIKVPFAVVTPALTQTLTFDIDAVRDEK